MKNLAYFLLIVHLLLNAAFAEQSSVKVIALFNDKALLQVNGEQKIVRKNETYNGVKLLSSSSRGALVQFSDGEQKQLNINQAISHGFSQRDKSKVTVYANPQGMFMVAGKVNGKPTHFLLDTGASSVALSQAEADRLGLPYESSPRSYVNTASEVVPVWNIKLGQVRVGDISVSNVDAFVLQGNKPDNPLLGMSFLQHLKLNRSGAVMTLEQKY